jgi:diaminopimelate decarboxylase
MNFPWAGVVQEALSKHSAPLYLSAWAPVKAALEDLNRTKGVLPIRNWLSFKTHPVAPLLRHWRDLGLGVEVVSEFEFLAALREGFVPSSILVNGVAKHDWLLRNPVRDCWVHFDSLAEIEALKNHVKGQGWKVGLRCHVSEEYDPDEPQFSGQFGMIGDEFKTAVSRLRACAIEPSSLHFHLRGNVRDADAYRRAWREAATICDQAQFEPSYVDFGGGLPVSGEWPAGEEEINSDFDLDALKEVFDEVPEDLPCVKEIWLENGRYITARSCVLVLQVLDIKERKDSRYLICNGGRTNHALVSDWESHEILTLPQRTAPTILTTICGSTCMAFDRLIRKQMPSDIRAGDHLVWMNAGAYHLPWETRFSHGLCEVLWYNQNSEFIVAREREGFEDWWSQWK